MIAKPTIFAVSSGTGRAGIAIVRVSGPAAMRALKALAGPAPAPRMASLRSLRAADGIVIDRALVLWFPGPATATGEDVAEFHVHGSAAVVQRLLRELAAIEGLELAAPGAFTRQAFDNQRLDLVEVEGLADLLAAETEAQRQLAMRQFLGEVSIVYEDWRRQLVDALALLEAAIDFVDESDVAQKAVQMAMPKVVGLRGELEIALNSADKVAAVRRGLRVVIAGPANVGKSSLLNWLVGRDAAIVSPVAGTTRDVVEAALVLEGLPVILADTAGLRSATDDAIELVGMNRSRREAERADLLVWVEAPDVADLIHPSRAPDIWIVNKSDLLAPDVVDGAGAAPGQFYISLKQGTGLQGFFDALSAMIRERTSVSGNGVVVRERHRAALEKTIRLLNNSLTHGDGALELVAEDVRSAARSLALVTGRVDVDDVLGQIFQEFCIGK